MPYDAPLHGAMLMSTDGLRSMTPNNPNAVLDGLVQLRDSAEKGDASLSHPAVPYLLGALNATSDPEQRSMLFSLLAIEYSFLGMDENELDARRASIEENKADPCARIALSEYYVIRGQYVDAVREARLAVGLSDSLGNHRRHALQTLARALRKTESFDELQVVLQTLLDLPSASPDSPIELDFLTNLPEGALSKDLVEKYASLRKKL